MNVVYQGEAGAYSQEAVLQHFGADTDSLPCRTFREVFERVERGEASHGIVPVENSTTGSVRATYDLLLDYDLEIWHEVVLRIRHCLMGNQDSRLEQVRYVRSHPEALAQCERYLVDHGMEPVPTHDTAGSARELAAAPQEGVAVVASLLAAQIYGLKVLETDCQDQAFNYTRFFMLSRQEPARTDHSKTSIVFEARHVPGSLHACLGEFAEQDVNLTKLESRPHRDRPWHYVFYLDFEGHRQDPVCKKALLGLQRRADFVRVLGSYPAAPVPRRT